MKDCLITIIVFFTPVTFNIYAQEIEWQNMYPLNDGDYWVYELYGPGGFAESTETKRIIGDSLESNNKVYKTVYRASYDYNGIFSYYENFRIDSFGVIYTKTKWDATEHLYLELDVAIGDTFPDPRDPFGGYWEVGDIWFDNENKRNIIYGHSGIVFTSIWIKEGIGNYDEKYEGGGNLVLKGAYINGFLIGDTTIVTSIESEKPVSPKSIQLLQNYPNPFNGQTRIKFYLPKSHFVLMQIYNLSGELINTLIRKNENQGEKIIIWDGTDNLGKEVSSGLYIYVLSNGQQTLSGKMLLIK